MTITNTKAMIPNWPAKTAASGAIASNPPNRTAAATAVSGCRDRGKCVNMRAVNNTIAPMPIHRTTRETTITLNERRSDPTYRYRFPGGNGFAVEPANDVKA